MVFKKFKKQTLSVSDFQETKNVLRVINSLQQAVEDSISPLVVKIQNDSLILSNITLLTDGYANPNIINHTLGRQLLGYKIVRARGQAQIWDSQDKNPSPNLTLWLHTSAKVVVDIEVF